MQIRHIGFHFTCTSNSNNTEMQWQLDSNNFQPHNNNSCNSDSNKHMLWEKKNKYVPRETARLTNTLARGHTSPNNKTADLLSAVAEWAPQSEPLSCSNNKMGEKNDANGGCYGNDLPYLLQCV